MRPIPDFAGREAQADTERVDLGVVTRALEPILARSLGEDVRLMLHSTEELWRVRGEEALVEQIVLNLVVNAREAMRHGGVLTVATENAELSEPLTVEGDVLQPGRYVVLSVCDTGPGIAERVRHRIFDRNVSTKDSDGAGIGLTTVHRIVRDWHGGIEVESQEGAGTTFSIYLPVAEQDVPERPPEAALHSRARPHGVQVLVVEHRPAVRVLVERELVREGHSVVAVGTAREGIEVFDRVKPRFQLVILGAALPQRSGTDLYRAMSGRVENLAAVLVPDGMRGGPDVVAGSALVVLTFPFSSVTLLSAVDRALAGTKRPLRGSAEAGA